jgi:hypothetical protein
MKEYFKNFLKGIASLNIYRPAPKVLRNMEAYEKDKKAIASDWEVIGKDLRKSMNKFSRKKDISTKLN